MAVAWKDATRIPCFVFTITGPNMLTPIVFPREKTLGLNFPVTTAKLSKIRAFASLILMGSYFLDLFLRASINCDLDSTSAAAMSVVSFHYSLSELRYSPCFLSQEVSSPPVIMNIRATSPFCSRANRTFVGTPLVKKTVSDSG